MNDKTKGAIKRIIREVKEKRTAECHDKNCVVNHQIGGNDIQIAEKFINTSNKTIEDYIISLETDIAFEKGLLKFDNTNKLPNYAKRKAFIKGLERALELTELNA